MTVYVDEIRTKAGRGALARLIADTDRELDQIAGRLGLSFFWFRGRHYEVSRFARTVAIRHGAREITRRQLSAMLALARRGEALGDPETSLARLAGVLRARKARRSHTFPDVGALTDSAKQAQASATKMLRSRP